MPVGIKANLPSSYVGGKVGVSVYAVPSISFTNMRITDLSDTNNMPTDYCDGLGSCITGNVFNQTVAFAITYETLKIFIYHILTTDKNINYKKYV